MGAGRKVMNKNLLLVLSFSLVIILACEPVFAIGWGELLLLFFLFVLLLGPPLYRLIRRIEELRKYKKKQQ